MNLLQRLLSFAASALGFGPSAAAPAAGARRRSKYRSPGRRPLSGYKLARRFFPGISRQEALQRFGRA